MSTHQTEQVRVYVPGRIHLRVVAIGGGHGLSNMLRGLKQVTRHLTAVVTVADDGGGSGMLRKDLGMLPPGDIRNCILALSNAEPMMEKLLDYRFQDGSLTGQSFGNLFLAALNGVSGSFEAAVKQMSDILAITGKVLPVTGENVELEATFENGETVLGESKIFYAKKENDCRIRQVRLLPENPAALPDSIRAIQHADLIVLGPGSLYTSVIPNLLVDGIAQAIAESHAKRIYVMNMMTQDGETEGYTGPDHVRALLRHGGADILDAVLANDQPIPHEVLESYADEGAEPLRLCREEIEAMGVQVFTYPMLAEGALARHDPEKLAEALMDCCHLIKKRR